MRIRRVVTGQEVGSTPRFVVDEDVDPMEPELLAGWQFHALWGYDTPPGVPNRGEPDSELRWFPESGNAVRFIQCTIPPDSTPQPEGLNVDAAKAGAERMVPGLIGVFEPNAPGMHRTDSIDFLWIMSGRCILDLDNGETVELGPNDTIVQNGTRHAWRNPFEKPCRLLAVLVGAEKRSG